MNIYVASSWRNEHQPLVVSALRSLGHQVYDFRNPRPGNDGFHWSDIDPDWQAWDVEGYVNGLDHPMAADGFRLDFVAMQEADLCVLVLPCGRSAHLEAGWFVGKGKLLVVVLVGPIEPELMYLMADAVCGGTTPQAAIYELSRVMKRLPDFPDAG